MIKKLKTILLYIFGILFVFFGRNYLVFAYLEPQFIETNNNAYEEFVHFPGHREDIKLRVYLSFLQSADGIALYPNGIDFETFYENHIYFLVMDSTNVNRMWFGLLNKSRDYIPSFSYKIGSGDFKYAISHYADFLYSVDMIINQETGFFTPNIALSHLKMAYSFLSKSQAQNQYLMLNPNVNITLKIGDTNGAFKFLSSTNGLPTQAIDNFEYYLRKSQSTLVNFSNVPGSTAPGSIFIAPAPSVTSPVNERIFSFNTTDYDYVKIPFEISVNSYTQLKDKSFWFYLASGFTQPGDGVDKIYYNDWIRGNISSELFISPPKIYLSSDRLYKDKIQVPLFDYNTPLKEHNFYIESLRKKSDRIYGYFYMDLSSLDDNKIITARLGYDSRYLQFGSIDSPNRNFTTFDMTDVYGVALVPKFPKTQFYHQLELLGKYQVFYAFENDVSNIYDYQEIDSSSYFKKLSIDFVKYNDRDKFSFPVFYIMNKSTNGTVNYLQDYYKLIVLEKNQETVSSDGSTYSVPTGNYNSKNTNGINDGENLNKSEYDVSNITLEGMIKTIPKAIGDIVGVFALFGVLLSTMFSSFPPIVQTVYSLGLILILIVIIKKGFFS